MTCGHMLSGTGRSVSINAVVAVKWMIGFLILAAFTITLSNTQPLLNKVLSGVL